MVTGGQTEHQIQRNAHEHNSSLSLVQSVLRPEGTGISPNAEGTADVTPSDPSTLGDTDGAGLLGICGSSMDCAPTLCSLMPVPAP